MKLFPDTFNELLAQNRKSGKAGMMQSMLLQNFLWEDMLKTASAWIRHVQNMCFAFFLTNFKTAEASNLEENTKTTLETVWHLSSVGYQRNVGMRDDWLAQENSL